MGYFWKDSSLWSQDVFARSVNEERSNLIPRDRGRKGRFFHGSYFLNRLPDRPNSNRIWVIAWSNPFLCRDCWLCWLMLSGKKDGDLIGRESCSSSSPFLSSDWSAEKGVDGRRYKKTLFLFSLLQPHSSKAKASSPLPSLPDPGSSGSSWISDSYGRQGEAAPAQPPQWTRVNEIWDSFLLIKLLWTWNSHFHCNCKSKKKGWKILDSDSGDQGGLRLLLTETSVSAPFSLNLTSDFRRSARRQLFISDYSYPRT